MAIIYWLFVVVGSICIVQRCHTAGGSMGSYRFCPPWIVTQLPLVSSSSWNVGANSWKRRSALDTSGTWYCWIRCWNNQVHIMEVINVLTTSLMRSRTVLWLLPRWNFWKVRYNTDLYRILAQFISVNLQLQLQRSSFDRQFKGPIDCLRQVVRAQGIRGLWTGSTGSFIVRGSMFWMFMSFEVSGSSTIRDLVLDLTTCRLLWEGFRHWKALSTKYVRTDSLSTRTLITSEQISTGVSNFLSGGLASFVFWTFAIPADNVKK